MKKLFNLFIVLPFLFIIFYIPIISFYLPEETFSQEEYRTLTTKETLEENDYNVETLEKYVVDQFPFRKSLVEMYTKQNLLLNKIYIRDAYLIDKSLILMKEYNLKKQDVENLFNVIEKTKNKFPNSSFYYATIPSKTYSLSEFAKNYIDASVPIRNKNLIEKYIPNNINYIDVTKYFSENFTKEERLDLYYKTDFHWNAIGAFKATEFILNTIINNENYNVNVDISDFDIQYLKERNFLGDLNRRFSYLIPKDTILPVLNQKDISKCKYYTSLDNSKEVKRNEIIGNGINSKDIDYNKMHTSNNAYYKVVNENALTDKKIIIFKDSYQNPTTDFFSYIFKECYILDPRFDTGFTFDELMKTVSPDIVLFFYHQSNISDELINFLSK